MSNERIVRNLIRAKLAVMALVEVAQRDDEAPEEAAVAANAASYIQDAIDELGRVSAY